jgi:hypothetical protein
MGAGARYAPAWPASACAPSAVKIRTTVSGCGATRTPRASRVAPAAASTSCDAACTRAVTSSIAVFPDSTAAVHKASTHGRECRIPRVPRVRDRREALQQVPARRQLCQASSAQAGTGMRD